MVEQMNCKGPHFSKFQKYAGCLADYCDLVFTNYNVLGHSKASCNLRLTNHQLTYWLIKY